MRTIDNFRKVWRFHFLLKPKKSKFFVFWKKKSSQNRSLEKLSHRCISLVFDYKLWLDVLQIANYTKSRNCYHQILFDENFPSLLTQQKNGIDCRIHMLKRYLYQFSAIICRMSHIREGWLCHARIILSISFEFSAFLLMFAYVCSMYIQKC